MTWREAGKVAVVGEFGYQVAGERHLPRPCNRTGVETPILSCLQMRLPEVMRVTCHRVSIQGEYARWRANQWARWRYPKRKPCLPFPGTLSGRFNGDSLIGTICRCWCSRRAGGARTGGAAGRAGRRNTHEWTPAKQALLAASTPPVSPAFSWSPSEGGFIAGPKNLALALAAFELAWVDAGAATGSLAGCLALSPIHERGTRSRRATT